ncbi:hypothetical protein [Bacillus sp. Marseille-P3661]|uniref:hypothetical protein n=1 Tax=Bacillus sp. Marseille-P3661 TaxID=1936234 RepID=UPI000C833116|nr:hypothetical protein [Bacillus sp. Marseille-P3661]
MIDQQQTYAETQALTFTETTVVLMPEYNKHPNKDINEPNLLIGFHGTLINQTEKLISEITIPVPTNIENLAISLVASPTENEEVNEIKHTLNEKAEDITLYFVEPIAPGATKKIMIEYFYTPITAAGGKKSFTYDYKAFADAESMNLILFEPYYTEKFTTVPESDRQATDSMGVKMHLYQYQDIKKGETKHYEFSYIKEDDLTTMEMVEQITSDNAKTAHDDVTQENSVQPGRKDTTIFNADMTFGILLIALIIFCFIAWFVRKRKHTKERESLEPISKKLLNKKELRKMLAAGELDEEQYIKELSKLG